MVRALSELHNGFSSQHSCGYREPIYVLKWVDKGFVTLLNLAS